jgi:hypothetical protein
MNKRLGLLVVIAAIGCVLVAPATASATTWRNLKVPASFRTYAKHARKHGMKPWLPRQVPAGYKLTSITFGDVGNAGPYSDIVFKKGSTRITFGQGTVVGADGEMPSRDAMCTWGSFKAAVYKHNSLFGKVVWFGPTNDYGGLAGSASLSTLQAVAKRMRPI